MASRPPQTRLPLLGFLSSPAADLDDLFAWLESNDLTRHSTSYQEIVGAGSVAPNIALGIPSQRAKKKTRDEIKHITDQHQALASQELTTKAQDWNRFWQELQNPKEAIRTLKVERLPADAMAFYRPFHYPPFDQWGIYLLAQPLLQYFAHLNKSLGQLHTFTPSTLMTAVLFEIFHHEFFHHLAEATATALEIICAGLGQTRPIYLDYRAQQYELEIGRHPHHPLEEALANAYAYNSLSFIRRVKVGYSNQMVKLYQAAVVQVWPQEPAGYCDAAAYIKENYVTGAAQLIAMMLGTSDALQGVPLTVLAKHVFPQGHMALVAKPDIPTYIVGTPTDVEQLYTLVPAPNEAYTNLFWPGKTDDIDKQIAAEQQRLREMKKAQKNEDKLRT